MGGCEKTVHSFMHRSTARKRLRIARLGDRSTAALKARDGHSTHAIRRRTTKSPDQRGFGEENRHARPCTVKAVSAGPNPVLDQRLSGQMLIRSWARRAPPLISSRRTCSVLRAS